MPACKKRNVQYFNLSVLLNCFYCYIKAATNALYNQLHYITHLRTWLKKMEKKKEAASIK